MADEPVSGDGTGAKLSDPLALLPLAAIAVAVFGIAHLISDLFAWDGDTMGDIGGVVTDSYTTVTGLALLVGLIAVVDRDAPDPAGGWSILGWAAKVRADPRGVMSKVLGAVLALGVVQAVIAFTNTTEDGGTFTTIVLVHDVMFLLAISAFVGTFAAVAIARDAQPWPLASRVRDLLAVALIAAPLLGGLLAILWFVELNDADTGFALAYSSFALLETLAAITLLVVGNVIVRTLFPPDAATDKVTLPGPAQQVIDDPSIVLDRMIAFSIALAGIHLLLATANYGDFGGSDGFRAFMDAAFDGAAVVALIAVVRSAVVRGPLNLMARSDGEGGSELGTHLRSALILVGALGVLNALVAVWFYRDTGWIAWYWMFNRLVRTAIVVGVLAGLGALHKPKVAAETP